MKSVFIVLSGMLMLAGCTTQPDAPMPPKVGMANPASVYCQQKGGLLIAVQTPQGYVLTASSPEGSD